MLKVRENGLASFEFHKHVEYVIYINKLLEINSDFLLYLLQIAESWNYSFPLKNSASPGIPLLLVLVIVVIVRRFYKLTFYIKHFVKYL